MRGRILIPPFVMICVAVSASGAEPAVDFNRDIRPILSANCFACHGRDEEAREADLRLDTREGTLQDLGGYRALEPGKPDDSELISRVETDDKDDLMPPPDSGHELTAEEKQKLRDWVSAGGEYQTHWSFVPPVKVSLPLVKGRIWVRHPIDGFVLAGLEAKGLSASEPADRFRLIRRLSLDLTGLPPTLEEADAFVADESGQAVAKVIDRLLASKAFGEHWARMWLDLARYADTKGYEKDKHRDIWRYRDWVIEAFNRDLPFDQFTIEQLAGDLLPNATSEQQLATAFHRNTMSNDEGGTDNEEFRVAAVKDRVDTTIQAWMGLTMGCAKCHSHKYDPIGLDDYYAFYAFFNQTEDADLPSDAPVMAAPTKWQNEQIAKLEGEMASLQAQLKKMPEGFDAAFAEWKKQFEKQPLWQALNLVDFSAKQEGITLDQREDGTLVATGKRPQKDTWVVTLELPEGNLTGLRLDTLPKTEGLGDWPDGNVALREIKAELVEATGKSHPLKLTNARADFSQANWDVAKAIDGNEKTGWALSPKFGEPHVAVFDFEKPLEVKSGAKLRLVLDQNYGDHLVLARFRISVSAHPAKYLAAKVDPKSSLRDLFARHQFPATTKLHQQLDAARKSIADTRAKIPKTPVMRELAANKRRETRIHNRGNFLDPGDPVESGAPAVFGSWPEGAPQNRLGVAQWMVQPENPLTARVMVNRVWARLFGIGIVETEEDFGSQGLNPSHPELLDWLAVDFRENGWSLKKLIRSIVMSSTYQQSAAIDEERLAADPNNRLLSRGARYRLPAETVRDQALEASGLLNRKLGGPSVMPPQPAGVWKSTYSNLSWKDAADDDRYRRGLYTYWKRTSPYPAMITFDAGSGEVCQIRRIRTNTPLQALVTLNDPAFVEAAGALAGKMSAEKGELPEQIENGFRRVLIRPPSEKERDRLMELYESMQAEFSGDPETAQAFLKSAGLEQGDAAMVAIANVLLNLDETLMKP